MTFPSSIHRKDHQACNYKVQSSSEDGIVEGLRESTSLSGDFDNVNDSHKVADEKDGAEVPSCYCDRLGNGEGEATRHVEEE